VKNESSPSDPDLQVANPAPPEVQWIRNLVSILKVP
jgi:hypothetical protein